MRINSENYVENVLRTESCDLTKVLERLKNDKTLRLLHAALGAVTEAGELADMLKKHLFYGKELDWVNAQEEVGDLLWYAGVAADVMEVSLDDIMTRNISKLQRRYPEKFTSEKAINRDVEHELEVFDTEDNEWIYMGHKKPIK